MKPSNLLLAGSLVANAALLGHLFAPSSAPLRLENTPPTADARLSSDQRPASSDGNPIPADKTPLLGGTPARAGLPELIAGLRQAGYPISVIRAIVNARLADKFTSRRAALFGTAVEIPPFWKSDASASTFLLADPARRAEYEALTKDWTDALKDLLGDDYRAETEESLVKLAGDYGDLPPAKLTQVSAINRSFGTLSDKLRDPTTPHGLKRAEAVRQWNEERQAALAQVLSPEERAEYDLRSSPASELLRTRLTAFSPTEEEFRTIARLQLAFDAQYGGAGGLLSPAMTTEESRLRYAHLPDLDKQMAEALGPERYSDYKRSLDGAQPAGLLVARLGLPPQTAGKLLALEKDLKIRANKVETDDQRSALAALAIQQLAPTLGSKGLAIYQAIPSGDWLRRLMPTSDTTSPGATATSNP